MLGHVPGVGAGQDHPQVMKGWHTIYTSSDARSPFTKDSTRDQLLAKFRELVDLHKDENLSVTLVGHILDACLATLSVFDIIENGLSKVGDQLEFPVCAVVFGSPQVGDAAFVARLGRLPNLRVLHVRNEIDHIPQYPRGVLGYVSVDEQLVVDIKKSPYLNYSKNPSD
ncbi:hypothetical protein Taro_001587 [Colocasia esculenta]|uniref:Phospholipase A1 n=1 Tax=Colocasia esculenta TaxID=4460 RepID=A0A843TII7_COLES|nr:hypothetical protein [Colocasia esculenta]